MFVDEGEGTGVAIIILRTFWLPQCYIYRFILERWARQSTMIKNKPFTHGILHMFVTKALMSPMVWPSRLFFNPENRGNISLLHRIFSRHRSLQYHLAKLRSKPQYPPKWLLFPRAFPAILHHSSSLQAGKLELFDLSIPKKIGRNVMDFFVVGLGPSKRPNLKRLNLGKSRVWRG